MITLPMFWIRMQISIHAISGPSIMAQLQYPFRNGLVLNLPMQYLNVILLYEKFHQLIDIVVL